MANNTEDVELKTRLEIIAARIGSPWGEGATYERDRASTESDIMDDTFYISHLDDDDRESFISDLYTLIQQEANRQKLELLDANRHDMIVMAREEYTPAAQSYARRRLEEIDAERKQLEEKDISQRTSDGRRIKNGWNPRGEML